MQNNGSRERASRRNSLPERLAAPRFLTSPKHIRPQPPSQKAANFDELENVTARVSHRAQFPPKEKNAPRKDPAVHVSLSSDSIVKQQSRQTANVKPGPNETIRLTSEPSSDEPRVSKPPRQRPPHQAPRQRRQTQTERKNAENFPRPGQNLTRREEPREVSEERKPREAKSASAASAAPLPMTTIYGPPTQHVKEKNAFGVSANFV